MDKSPIREGDGGGNGNGLPPKPSRDGAALSLSPSPSPPPESDTSHMPDSPPRNLGHSRAHSDIIGLSDDLDLGVPGCGNGPSLSDENEEELFSMFLDAEKLKAQLCEASEMESSCALAGADAGPRPRHHQDTRAIPWKKFHVQGFGLIDNRQQDQKKEDAVYF